MLLLQLPSRKKRGLGWGIQEVLLGWVGSDLGSTFSFCPVVAWPSHSCLSACQGRSAWLALLWAAGLPLVPSDTASVCD